MDSVQDKIKARGMMHRGQGRIGGDPIEKNIFVAAIDAVAKGLKRARRACNGNALANEVALVRYHDDGPAS